jgi:hypothetical protein
MESDESIFLRRQVIVWFDFGRGRRKGRKGLGGYGTSLLKKLLKRQLVLHIDVGREERRLASGVSGWESEVGRRNWKTSVLGKECREHLQVYQKTFELVSKCKQVILVVFLLVM